MDVLLLEVVERVEGVALANNKAPVTLELIILLCVGTALMELAPEEVPRSWQSQDVALVAAA